MNGDQRHPPEAMQVELASLFFLLGGLAAKHLVVVGGLVPPLLAPQAPDPHLGSADIDLSLSLAITKGETSEYYRSLEKMIEPYFELAAGGFRWRKRAGVAGIPLLVDFLGPDAEGTRLEDGTMELENETATLNTGIQLRPFPLDAAEIVEEDAEERVIEGVPLVYNEGVRADVRIRHAGSVGFLASKANAFGTRSDSKDGYDVSWWCLNAAGRPEEVAALVVARPAFRNPYFQESVALLKSAFKEVEYPGPSGYAAEMNPGSVPGEPAYDRDRNAAYLAVSGVLEIVLENLWEDI